MRSLCVRGRGHLLGPEGSRMNSRAPPRPGWCGRLLILVYTDWRSSSLSPHMYLVVTGGDPVQSSTRITGGSMLLGRWRVVVGVEIVEMLCSGCWCQGFPLFHLKVFHLKIFHLKNHYSFLQGGNDCYLRHIFFYPEIYCTLPHPLGRTPF